MYNKIILRRTKSNPFYIDCHVSDGSRPVNFRWELNGVSVNGSKESDVNSGNEVVGHLYISALKPSHQGTYTCFTDNIVGSHRKDIFVTVVGMLVGVIGEFELLLCCMTCIHTYTHTHIHTYTHTHICTYQYAFCYHV